MPALEAQEQPINADRPGFADGSSLVGARRAQVEVGVTLEHDAGSAVNLPTLVRFGLNDFLELRIESDFAQFSHGDANFAPVAVGAKVRLHQGDMPLALIASVQPRSGSGSLRTTALECEARLVSDIDLGSGLSLVPNIGVSLAESESAVPVVAASLEKEIGNAVPFVDFEFQSGHGQRGTSVDGGIAWIVNPETQLDVSGGRRISGEAYSKWFVSVGFSRRLRRNP